MNTEIETVTAVEDMVHCRDSFNVFAQGGAGRDGGDGLNRIGVAYSCMAALGAQKDDFGDPVRLGLLTTLMRNSMGGPNKLPYGRFRRHPDPTRWYYNENNVTRDQMIPVEAALALVEPTDLAVAHMKLRRKRAFFHFSGQNDGADAGPLIVKKWYQIDLLSLSELATLARACRAWYLYPLICLFDLQLLLDVKWGRSASERNLWDSDNQLLPQMLAAIKVYPTPLSALARKIYAGTDAKARLTHYHGLGEMPELGRLCCLAFDKVVCK
jgi:hypothetical protein